MKQTINFSQFCDSFRGSYENNFSYEGKMALFDYLENYEDETGEEIELDPISLCCEYAEYNSFKEIKKEYPNIINRNDLEDTTIVIECDNGHLIIQNF